MRNTFISFLLLFAALSVAQTTFMVPMRDSVRLATDIYLPPDTADNPVPILLNRTPYGRDDVDEEFRDTLMGRGVGFAIQDSRGRGASEGVDSLACRMIDWLDVEGTTCSFGSDGEGNYTYLGTYLWDMAMGDSFLVWLPGTDWFYFINPFNQTDVETLAGFDFGPVNATGIAVDDSVWYIAGGGGV